MRFPDSILYQPTAKDFASASVLAQRYSVTLTSVVAAASVAVYAPTAEIPLDRVLILTLVFADATGNGAQVPVFIDIDVLQTGGASYRYRVMRQLSNVAGIRMSATFEGEILLFTGDQIRGFGSFSAAALANTLTLSVHGYLVPRATMQDTSF